MILSILYPFALWDGVLNVWGQLLYQQVFAIPVMEDVEQRALASSPFNPLFWRRYVNDVTIHAVHCRTHIKLIVY